MLDELDIHKIREIKSSELNIETTGCTFITPKHLIFPLDNVNELKGMSILTGDQIVNFMKYRNARIRCINGSCETEQYDRHIFHCDSCKEIIDCYEPRYSNINDSYIAHSIDFHEQCFKKLSVSKIEELQKSYVSLINNNQKCWNNFGSLFDWIPIYTSTTNPLFDAAIHICGNKNSILFNRIALSSCDSHGRLGISVIDLSYKQLVDRYQSLEQKEYSLDSNSENSGDS